MDRRLRDRVPPLTWNPFRAEGAAFQLVFITIGVCGLIAIGSWISKWVGLGVVAALVVAGGAFVLRWWRPRAAAATPRTRLLVVGEPTAQLVSHDEVRVVGDEAAIEEALATFAADEIVVIDPARVETLRARFVVQVRAATAEDYLPEIDAIK